ncbi:MAG: hypothetical protein JWO83_1708 [Caulobacteraceae bacterium]|nr:hypothetical protein [Caulobacteraceae bacterium]
MGIDYVHVDRYNNNIVVFFASDSTGQTFSNCAGGQATRTCVAEPHPSDLNPLLNAILIASDPNAALPSTFHIYIDSDLDAVPEPASWTMMVLGFGLVGLLARRRERQPSAALQRLGDAVHA